MPKIEVLAINISPTKGALMEARNTVTVLKDKGLTDDRYALGTGAYSKSPRENVPPGLGLDRKIVRDVSLISQEAIAAANHQAGTNFSFTDTRRNILVQGVEDLRELIGVVFTIGGVAMLGIEACDPCDRPSKLSGKTGFNAAFQDKGGLRARALEDGEIAVGDELKPSQT